MNNNKSEINPAQAGEPNDQALAPAAQDVNHGESEKAGCQQRPCSVFRCVWHWIRKRLISLIDLPVFGASDPKGRLISGAPFQYQWWKKP